MSLLMSQHNFFILHILFKLCLVVICYGIINMAMHSLCCPLLQAPWLLTFWILYEEVRVLAGVGNF